MKRWRFSRPWRSSHGRRRSKRSVAEGRMRLCPRRNRMCWRVLKTAVASYRDRYRRHRCAADRAASQALTTAFAARQHRCARPLVIRCIHIHVAVIHAGVHVMRHALTFSHRFHHGSVVMGGSSPVCGGGAACLHVLALHHRRGRSRLHRQGEYEKPHQEQAKTSHKPSM